LEESGWRVTTARNERHSKCGRCGERSSGSDAGA
jgi:hypothetical protein